MEASAITDRISGSCNLTEMLRQRGLEVVTHYCKGPVISNQLSGSFVSSNEDVVLVVVHRISETEVDTAALENNRRRRKFTLPEGVFERGKNRTVRDERSNFLGNLEGTSIGEYRSGQ